MSSLSAGSGVINMAVYHNYIAVIGRIPFDDDDSCMIFEQKTEEEARKAFAFEMFRSRAVSDEQALENQQAEIKSIGGDLGVYITHVLASQSPIEQLYEHQG